MCGLVGIAGNILGGDTKFFEQALFADQLRGKHSTGIFVVDDKAPHNVTYLKKAVTAADFIQTAEFKSMNTVKQRVIAGHNRFATQGAHTDENAHPFVHGNITLMHNGTLDNRAGLNTENYTVDSEHIAATVGECETDEEVVAVLEKIEGAFALVWFNHITNKLNFARNDERVLNMAMSRGVIYWASEGKMLDWLLSRNNITISQPDKQRVVLPVGEMWSFDMDKVNMSSATRTVTKFTPTVTSWASQYNSWYPTAATPAKPTTQTIKRTVALTNFPQGSAVGVRFHSFTPYGPSTGDGKRGRALGVTLGASPQPVILYNVEREALMGAIPNRVDFSRTYTTTTVGSDIVNGVSSIMVSAIDLKWEVTSEKKHLQSSTKGRRTVELNTGFRAGAISVTRTRFLEIQNDGCEWCNIAFSEGSMKKVVLKGDGYFCHKGACSDEYDRLFAGDF